jgi:NAD(P)-dependent dehydrogenase (short-subunit alcohol dehydrogenase family)
MQQPGDRKTIFITGAGSGIGRACAKLFAERGWFVGLYDVNGEGLLASQKLLPPGRFISGQFDVRDREAWRTAIGQFADAAGGRLNVLFNNAGIAHGGWFEDIAEADADRIIDVNFKGVMYGCYAALPYLKSTPGARIINTSSASGFYGVPKMAVYSATKHAVHGLSEALDLEFARHGVRVAYVAPWFIDTAILDAPGAGSNAALRETLTQSKAKIYSAEAAAEVVFAAAHGPGGGYQVGAEAKRAALFSRLLPGLVRAQMKKMLDT